MNFAIDRKRIRAAIVLPVILRRCEKVVYNASKIHP